MTGKFARDEEALEPLVLLVGIAIILIGVVIMWALGVLIWLAVGALFAVGGMFVVQATPARGWLGVILGAMLIGVGVVLSIIYR